LSASNRLFAAEIGTKHRGNADATVRVLERLENPDHHPRQREAAAVQRVHMLWLCPSRAEADVRPPGLEIPEQRARAHLEPLVAARSPDLDVELASGGEAEVAGTHLDHTVAKAESATNLLGRVDEALELCIGRLGTD